MALSSNRGVRFPQNADTILTTTIRAARGSTYRDRTIDRVTRTATLLQEEPVLTLWPTLGALGRSGAALTAIGGL